MAKRVRLTPAIFNDAAPLPQASPVPASPGLRRPAPIAQVAGEAATQAAFDEVASELARARSEGRLVMALPLDSIDETHLVRDRLAIDDDEMTALRDSLRERGQQTPIEVVALSGSEAPRYGLISGWRRLTALRQLQAETGDDRFAAVRALLRQPASAAEAYLAMVEENEVRANLSHYERARIAARAAEIGAFPTPRHAIKTLFANASRARRSKIGSFLRVYEALEGSVRFPAAIPERLGLRLAQVLDDDSGAEARLKAALAGFGAAGPSGPEEEQAALDAALVPPGVPVEVALPVREQPATQAAPKSGKAGKGEEVAPGVFLAHRAGSVTFSGPGVDQALVERLLAALGQG